ncbi:MAG TPA: hypothetical protein VHE99_10995 [Gammaproteobacteria bacterium]|nr:hypothetical protein [Gammaproteobacteria bacterium]
MQDQKTNPSLQSEPSSRMRLKRKISDLRVNKMQIPESKKFRHEAVADDFELWLKSMKLDDSTEKGLQLIHAAALDDLAKIRDLIAQISPNRVYVGGVTEKLPKSGYARYLNSSPFHWACSDEARELLCDNMDMNVIALVDGEGLTPLARCVCMKDLAGVKYWVCKGAIINSEEDPLGVLKLAVQDKSIFEYLSFRGDRIRKLEDLKKLEKIAIQKNATEALEIIRQERRNLEWRATLSTSGQDNKHRPVEDNPDGSIAEDDEATVLIRTPTPHYSPSELPSFFEEQHEKFPTTERQESAQENDKLLPGLGSLRD